MLSIIALFIIGAVIGVAHVVPGVSGGTFAVIFNVYDRLIAVITPNIKKILSEWKFLLPMGIGTLAGILAFAKAFTYLYDNFQAPTMCFFVGIIAGSLPLIYRKSCPQTMKLPPFSSIISAVIALGVMMIMAFMNPDAGQKEISAITPLSFIFLLAAGTISAIAMILPGISGSFILLILGVYQAMMFSVDQCVQILFKLIRGSYSSFGQFIDALFIPAIYLAPIVIGIIFGTFFGAAIVRFLLKHIPLQTYGAILGLVAGSMVIIFPFGKFAGVAPIAVSVIVFLAGTAISYIFSVFEGRKS